jgi:general secretion pathway protein G
MRAVTTLRPHLGFTLLELLVVLVIIGLLAGYVGPRFFSQIGKSETKVAQAQVASLAKALDAYRIDTGGYPSTEQGLEALWRKPSSPSRWEGPYLQKEPPLDPWGRPYNYRTPGQQGDFDLFTLGKDGKEGGEREDQDIRY